MNFPVSVIVPLATDEEGWPALIGMLDFVEADDEILLASSEPPPSAFQPNMRIRWIKCPDVGRAQQMNHAVAASSNGHLWFLHADSSIDRKGYECLQESLQRHPDGLHYYRLRFLDGGGLMRLNECGANLRSRWLGAPFGDQGFCLSRRVFDRIGGYDETATYGEDHLLARKARRDGVKLCEVDYEMGTSARRYQKEGWLKLVLLYQWKWIRQALSDR